MPDHREHLQNVSKPIDPTWGQRLWDWIWGLAKTADRAPGPQHLHEVSFSARRRWLDRADNLKGGHYRPAPLAATAEALNALSPADYGVDKSLAELNDPSLYHFHPVRAGDSLSKLAKLYYGDPAREGDILAANRDSLWEAAEISAGGTLRVPLPLVPQAADPA